MHPWHFGLHKIKFFILHFGVLVRSICYCFTQIFIPLIISVLIKIFLLLLSLLLFSQVPLNLRIYLWNIRQYQVRVAVCAVLRQSRSEQLHHRSLSRKKPVIQVVVLPCILLTTIIIHHHITIIIIITIMIYIRHITTIKHKQMTQAKSLIGVFLPQQVTLQRQWVV